MHYSISFFYRFADHRNLHSFPTRRSSDLDFCATHGVPNVHSGKLVVAHDEHEIHQLEALMRRGTENGVNGLEIVDRDRKSTRLNSSHTVISYAVFRLKKKRKNQSRRYRQS